MSSIKINSSKTISNVFLAPMSGITDYPFRVISSKFGNPNLICEMIASKELIKKDKSTLLRAKKHTDNNNIPFLIQLLGRNPDEILEAAKISVDNGADVIDINMGCPAKKVTSGDAGASLMREPKLAVSIIELLVKKINVPITVKMRLGWDKDNMNVIPLSKDLESSGMSMLTVHGRTRDQFYNGLADWSYISKIKDNIKVPLIANGDISSIDSAKECLRITKADGVMIGRAALGAPWLPGQIQSYINDNIKQEDQPLNTICNTIITHYEMLLSCYGIERGNRISRKHISWYISKLNTTHDVKVFLSEIYKQTNPIKVKSMIKSYLLSNNEIYLNG
ncbi:MAG: tRNA dihydrouridine synthase DusB [Rhodobiaceae bacterium]|nr:tRNA dihydrouridine synthase DusB [Rhodobiaceae bacterium]MBT6223085.1 tRNA dihydrouridine synthase DusB [Rhodobiaceae bacterium]